MKLFFENYITSRQRSHIESTFQRFASLIATRATCVVVLIHFFYLHATALIVLLPLPFSCITVTILSLYCIVFFIVLTMRKKKIAAKHCFFKLARYLYHGHAVQIRFTKSIT